MIRAVAFCPQAPVLVPELAQGAATELEDLRAACRTAIGRLAAPGRQLVVLGGGTRNASHGPTSRGTFAPYGLPIEVPLGSDEPGETCLPPSLTVGAWLLRDALGANCGAVAHEIAGPDTDGAWDERHGDVGVLVMGDGSARRSVKAPGYLDDRAAPYDALVADALSTGNPEVLATLDPVLGAELLVSGVAAWRLVGGLLAHALPAYRTPADARSADTGWRAELGYDAAPYGVGYLVASWVLRG